MRRAARSIRTLALWNVYGALILASAGCANLGVASSCPDIAGTYANKAEGAAESLSALLLPGRPGTESVRFVSVVEDESREQLIATAGSQHATLRRGSDYIARTFERSASTCLVRER